MKYLEMLKNESQDSQNEKKDKSAYLKALPKLPKGTYDSFDSSPGKHIPEKNYFEPDPFDHEISGAIRLFNDAGVNIMDFPAEVRHRALELEEQLTQAANEGDRNRYTELLRQWRECFH